MGVQLHATGGAHDVLAVNDLLRSQVTSIGHGRDGSLMRLVSRAAGGLVPEDAIDGVFFFIDPVNPTSTYPETLALERSASSTESPLLRLWQERLNGFVWKWQWQEWHPPLHRTYACLLIRNLRWWR